MPLIMVCDTETTGVKVETDRICEFAALVFDQETRKLCMTIDRRIDPTVNIPAKTTSIHGIANSDVVGCPAFKQLAPTLANLFAKVDVVIGHNFEGFDARILLHEFIRAGVVLTKFPAIFDTCLAGRWATPDGKMPTLGELAWSLDVPYDTAKAHSALYDIQVNADAFWRGIDLGVFTMPQPESIAA